MSKHILVKLLLAIISGAYLLIAGYGFWIQSFIITTFSVIAFVITVACYILLIRLEEIKEEIVIFISGLEPEKKEKIINEQINSKS